MSVTNNINTIISAANGIKSPASITVGVSEKYMPDCVVVAKEANKFTAENNIAGYYAFSEPFRNDSVKYYDFFDTIESSGTDINTLPSWVKRDRYHLIYEASIEEINILNYNGKTLYPGNNYKEYMLWADATVRFYNDLVKADNLNEVPALEKEIFGGMKNYGDYTARVTKLMPLITEAKVKIINRVKEAKAMKNNPANKPAINIFKRALRDYKANYNRSETRDLMDANRIDQIRSTLADYIISRNNEANNKLKFTSNDFKNKAMYYAQYAFDIDYNVGEITLAKEDKINQMLMENGINVD
jgi:hypothetical protein